MLLPLILIPLAAALVCLLIDNRRVHEYATVCACAAISVGALFLARGALLGETIKSSGGIIYVDALSAFMLLIITLLSLAAAIYSIEYMGSELDSGHLDGKTHRYYYLLYNLFIFTMVLIPIANNLAVLWMAVEGTTLASALLVGLYRKRQSIEAAWKYIILCTVGITFALLGTFIIYYASSGVSGGKGALEWTTLLAMAPRLNPATVRLGFIVIVVGYGTKAGLAPVHNWLPDAHSEAPTPISALLSGILLNCAFYGIMRFAVIARASLGYPFVRDMMFLFGISSVVVASTFMLIQRNAKRLLAYSSIEHMGIIALSFGVGGPFGFYAALLHILNHAIGKPLMFFVTGRIKSRYGTVESEQISGVLKTMPLVGAVGFAGIMALAGAPPFGMFISEFLMLKGMAAEGHWVIMGIFLAASGMVFYGLLRSFGGMFLGAPSPASPVLSEPLSAPISAHMPLPVGADIFRPRNYWPVGLTIFLIAGVLLALGLYIPGPLDRLITASAGIIGG